MSGSCAWWVGRTWCTKTMDPSSALQSTSVSSAPHWPSAPLTSVNILNMKPTATPPASKNQSPVDHPSHDSSLADSSGEGSWCDTVDTWLCTSELWVLGFNNKSIDSNLWLTQEALLRDIRKHQAENMETTWKPHGYSMLRKTLRITQCITWFVRSLQPSTGLTSHGQPRIINSNGQPLNCF